MTSRNNGGEQLDLFGDSPFSVDVSAELEALAVRLSIVGTWSNAASAQSRGLMIGLLTAAGYPDREEQLALLGKLLQHTVCVAGPYTSLTSRKAITQSVVRALIDWMIHPYRPKKQATIRWPAVKTLDALFSGKATMPKTKMDKEDVYEETAAANAELFDL